MNYFKNKQIIKEGSKVFEKAEVNKVEIQKQLDLLDAEENRRIAEIQAEFQVKREALNIYLI